MDVVYSESMNNIDITPLIANIFSDAIYITPADVGGWTMKVTNY